MNRDPLQAALGDRAGRAGTRAAAHLQFADAHGAQQPPGGSCVEGAEHVSGISAGVREDDLAPRVLGDEVGDIIHLRCTTADLSDEAVSTVSSGESPGSGPKVKAAETVQYGRCASFRDDWQPAVRPAATDTARFDSYNDEREVPP